MAAAAGRTNIGGLSRRGPVGFLDVVPANKPERLPVVFSRQEVATLLLEFESLRRLMFLVMYGAGLRHAECRRLRVEREQDNRGEFRRFRATYLRLLGVPVPCGGGTVGTMNAKPGCDASYAKSAGNGQGTRFSTVDKSAQAI